MGPELLRRLRRGARVERIDSRYHSMITVQTALMSWPCVGRTLCHSCGVADDQRIHCLFVCGTGWPFKSGGFYKSERVIASTQSSEIELADGSRALNFCANNYLGLADNECLRKAAKDALDRYGYGMASVRFMCGTQEVHTQVERRISSFLKMEDAILYSSCLDANAGLFETLLGEEDAIIFRCARSLTA